VIQKRREWGGGGLGPVWAVTPKTNVTSELLQFLLRARDIPLSVPGPDTWYVDCCIVQSVSTGCW